MAGNLYIQGAATARYSILGWRDSLGTWGVPGNSSASALSTVQSPPYSFNYGQTNTPFTITVQNAAGAAATSGTVTVTDTLPAGLTLVSMSGTGWTCAANTCTRADSLAGGSSYPPITVTVNVAVDATSPQTNVVSVSGGGSAPFGTFTNIDIIGPPLLTIRTTDTGSFAVGQTDARYYIYVTNQYGRNATSGPVTVTELLPEGLSLVSMTGLGWTCAGNVCSRSDSLAGGSSYDPIYATVSVAATAQSPVVNQVNATGGGSADATATDSTAINTNPPILTASITHTGDFYAGQSDATYTITVANRPGAPSTTGTLVVNIALSSLYATSMTGKAGVVSPLLSPVRAAIRCRAAAAIRRSNSS